MKMQRRTFLSAAGTTGAASALGFLGLDLGPSVAYAGSATARKGSVTSTICPFCAVGCGMLVTAADGEVLSVEGDPDHPVNLGALCSKGAALVQMAGNEQRLGTVRYRAPGSEQWEDKGLLTIGQNPAVSGPNAKVERAAMDKLEWYVAVDLWETESMAFWKRPGADPNEIGTEVFMLPAAGSMEKQGSVTNSGRWAQWRHEAVEPPGEARSDLWIITRLQRELAKLYAKDGEMPDPIVKLDWPYGQGSEPDPQRVAQQINGWFTADKEVEGRSFAKGDLVPGSDWLQDDGSTCSGNRLYAGSYVLEDGLPVNRMARRSASNPDEDPIGSNAGWAWCWPDNRRILYNRASSDAAGVPWAPDKPVVSYDHGAGRWIGDSPDDVGPPVQKADGTFAEQGKYAFTMLEEGHARLLVTTLADGPLPEHYEPLESPVDNAMSSQQRNPVIEIRRRREVGDRSEYPIVATTFRVAEHA